MLYLLVVSSISAWTADPDFYDILDVGPNASLPEIKRAWRQKALVHHPDKATGRGVAIATAEQDFRQVTEAYEVLTCPVRRPQYDRARSSTTQPSSFRGSVQTPSHFVVPNFFFGNPLAELTHLEPDIVSAQKRMVTVGSLEHLRAMALGVDGRLERGMLLAISDLSQTECFKKLKHGLRFPYPYAGWTNAEMSSGFWWEDVLQTYIAQYDIDGELTRFFNASECPTIVFARKGALLHEFKTMPHQHLQLFHGMEIAFAVQGFRQWVRKQLHVPLTVHNKHHSAVRVYWGQLEHPAGETNQQIAFRELTLLVPNQVFNHTDAGMAQIFLAYDAGVEGHRLTHNSSLAALTVTSWDETVWKIVTRCADSHTDCQQWARIGQCQANLEVGKKCTRSCGKCLPELPLPQDGETMEL